MADFKGIAEVLRKTQEKKRDEAAKKNTAHWEGFLDEHEEAVLQAIKAECNSLVVVDKGLASSMKEASETYRKDGFVFRLVNPGFSRDLLLWWMLEE